LTSFSTIHPDFALRALPHFTYLICKSQPGPLHRSISRFCLCGWVVVSSPFPSRLAELRLSWSAATLANPCNPSPSLPLCIPIFSSSSTTQHLALLSFIFFFFTLQCSLDSLPRLVPAVHGDVSETHRYIKTLCQPSQLDTADP
jgi:hypothetical protein